jgi:hypothetical protein
LEKPPFAEGQYANGYIGVAEEQEIIYKALITPAVGVNLMISAERGSDFRVRTAEMAAPASRRAFCARAFVRQFLATRRNGV